MNKKLLYLTTIILTLAGCSSEEYIGDPSLHEANDTPPIQFDGGTEVITRATSNTGTTAQKLDGQFKIYGVKSGATAGQNMQKVFMDYIAWYADNTANTTTSNSSGWEYVGDKDQTYGTGNVELLADQTIKYWDYSAKDYRFVAGSPVSAFEFNVNPTTNAIGTATITGLAGHLTANPVIDENTNDPLAADPIYVAKPKIVEPEHYKEAVTFEFVRQQAQVRVGIYETIPGYIISDIHFYTQDGTKSSNNNVILTSGTSGYFVGATDGSGTITYKNWDTTPSYTLTYSSGVTTAQNWYGGVFKPTDTQAAVKATSSTDAGLFGAYNVADADADMAANGFFTVLPTPTDTDPAPILIKCDYTLKSVEDNSNETIEVKGATAAIPAAFCKWAPNTMYTYLFKISDNTNGSTGQNKTGLYPITFAAVESDGGSMGTTTVVSAPSITTYQDGSVTATGIKYVANKTIYATVAAGETGQLLPIQTTGIYSAKVFYLGNTIGAGGSLTEEPTEAGLQVMALTEEQTYTSDLGETEVTVGTATLPAQDDDGYYYLTFTPNAAGYYAIRYQMSEDGAAIPVYVYKIVHVEE